MPDGLVPPLLFGLAYLGFAALALTVERHWRDLVEARAQASRRIVSVLRMTGGVALAAALAGAVAWDGWSFGILLWVLMLTAGAMAVAATVTVATARRRVDID